MSFSFTLFENEIESTLSAAIESKVAAMEPGDGKDEAEFLTEVIAASIAQLSRGEVEFSSAYVSGDVTNTKANLNVHVGFKKEAEEPKDLPPIPEPVAAPEGS